MKGQLSFIQVSIFIILCKLTEKVVAAYTVAATTFTDIFIEH